MHAMRNALKKLLLIVIIGSSVLVAPVCTWCDDGAAAAHRQFAFATALFEEGDYFRAISEFKRLIFYYPNHKELSEEAAYMICRSYKEARRWQDCINACSHFETLYPGSNRRDRVRLIKAHAEHQLKEYGDALSSYGDILKEGVDSSESVHKALYGSALTMVDMRRWDEARRTFDRIPPGSDLHRSAVIFAEGLKNIHNLPRKSPRMAGVFAALLPGAGHLYTERPRDALVAFLLNGAFIWATMELIEDENYVAGGLVGFFELGWYTGNIYSAVSSAQKYNWKTEHDFIQGLKEKSGAWFYMDPEAKCPCFMYAMRF